MVTATAALSTGLPPGALQRLCCAGPDSCGRAVGTQQPAEAYSSLQQNYLCLLRWQQGLAVLSEPVCQLAEMQCSLSSPSLTWLCPALRVKPMPGGCGEL